MRAALIAVLLATSAPAAAAPLALAERQVVVLEFQRPVTRVATTDPDLLHIQLLSGGGRVQVAALRGGRGSVELTFGDGAAVTYEVTVEGARRPQARGPGQHELELLVGEVRKFRAAGADRVLLEENGVARASVAGEVVSVTALAPGLTTVVVVDGAGVKTTWQIRVR